MKQKPKYGRGGRGRKEGNFLSHPLPVLLLAPFVAWSLTPVPRSLLINGTETLATQAKDAVALVLQRRSIVN